MRCAMPSRTHCWGRPRSATSGSTSPSRIRSSRGSPGSELLTRTVTLVAGAGLAPLLLRRDGDLRAASAVAPRRQDMRAALAAALGLEADAVSVKATRPEGLGLAGDGAGCLALAVLT